MEHLSINGIKIAYIEKNSEAANTIIFIHGNSVGKESWQKQYQSELFDDYRLVAIDLPGHGDSGPLSSIHYHYYTLKGLGEILSKVIEQLTCNKPFVLAGLSVGTNLIAEMLAFDVNPAGLVLSGPSVMNKKCPPQKFIKPDTHVGVVFTEEADEQDVRLYALETSLSPAREDIDLFVRQYKNTDKKFRSIFSQSIAEENYSDELALIKNSGIPCLVVFGKNENVVDPDYLDDAFLHPWKDTIFKIDGASHLVNIDQPGAFNRLMLEFVQDIFK